MPRCKLCGCDKKLVEAHIIPESLYPFDRDKREPLIKVTNVPNRYKSRSAKGEYDRNLVCLECEQLFSEWDRYAHKLLASEPPNQDYIRYRGKVLSFVVNDVEYDKLKLFFISLLWRASASTLCEFSVVKMGRFERELADMIQAADPGDAQTFAVTLAKFDDPLATGILTPHRQRWSGINYWHFYLGGYVAYVKVDHRCAPEPFRSFMLKPNEPLVILIRDYRGSSEFKLMRNLVRE